MGAPKTLATRDRTPTHDDPFGRHGFQTARTVQDLIDDLELAGDVPLAGPLDVLWRAVAPQLTYEREQGRIVARQAPVSLGEHTMLPAVREVIDVAAGARGRTPDGVHALVHESDHPAGYLRPFRGFLHGRRVGDGAYPCKHARDVLKLLRTVDPALDLWRPLRLRECLDGDDCLFLAIDHDNNPTDAG